MTPTGSIDMLLRVEQKHIAAGVPKAPLECPVALALQDTFREHWPDSAAARFAVCHPIGFLPQVVVRDDHHRRIFQAVQPADMHRFTRQFDAGERVEPTAFVLRFDPV